MGRLLVGLTLVAGACSARIGDGAGDGSIAGPTDAAADSAPDALVLGPWGPPTLVPGASGAGSQDDGSLTSTTLELVFSVVNTADLSRKDLYVQTRPSTSGSWTTPQLLPFSLVGSSEETPRFSADDLTLYFASDRAGGLGVLDVYMATRAAVGSPWSVPTLVPGVSSAVTDKWFAPCAGGRYLMVVGGDLAEGTLGGGPPTTAADLSSPQAETGSFLTPDCLTSYFASNRSGTFQIYTSSRSSIAAPWQPPTVVTDFAALGGAQEDPWLAPDQRTFALVSDIAGTKDVYLSTR